MWITAKECFVWVLDMWPVLKEVLPALGWGALWIGALQAGKVFFNPNSSPVWSWLQLAVLVYTVLTMCWNGYWVLHPSKQEVQWQRGTDDYGLN
ncbi:TPA: hypothetical protein P2R00_004115 [Aeromonas veronii]|nr:hypothetical protein [Aeromonas veronii]